jgi:DNA-directed RNA polymerase specialized sigma24 family protein
MGELENIFKKHKDWVDIVQTFGCNRETAEDLVQEMYIKIQLKINEGLDISFGDDDINHIYVFKTLRSLFLDLKRKEKNIYLESEGLLEDVESDFSLNNFDKVYDQVKEELNKMYWYDKKIFELIDNGKSIAKLSRETNISYYSLYNTYRKVIEKLKQNLWE